MKKIIPQTADKRNHNIDQIAQLFPQVICEKEDADGNTIKAIDFELFKQQFFADIVEGADERYRLDWPGKRASTLKANTPITSTLKSDRESSVNFDTTENIYIEGDNFEVLKILQESYLGKIKMIYIDPPYNTGKDFVYKDNFKVSKDDYETELGTEDEEGGKLFKNTDTNGRFHSDWLSMMYERLLVVRDLLTDDGVIFMSIDDNEVHNLRKIADEVFGEENFVSNVIWQSRTSISNDHNISMNHNHSLIFSKNISSLIFGGDRLNSKEYVNSDNDKRGPWKLVPIDANHTGGATYYPIINPKTKVEYYPPNGRIWAYNIDKFNKLLNEGRIKFGMNDDSSPKKKLYLNERIFKGDKKTPSSILLDAGTTKKGTTEIMNLFDNKKVFDYPKPTLLMKRFFDFGNLKNDDIVLDFFSGSGATAHATMQLNAEDGGNRKFIMVQIPEETDEKSEAFKAGYKTIPEIGKERIRRAGKKILEDNAEKLKERTTLLDIGFRVYKTSESILKEVAKHPKEVTQTGLFDSQDNIKEDATNEDILTSVILDFGLTLDSPIKTKNIANSDVFIVAEGALVACFNTNIEMQVIDTIAKMQPLRAVFRDACFKDDKDLINTVESRFKQLAPNTKVHVI